MCNSGGYSYIVMDFWHTIGVCAGCPIEGDERSIPLVFSTRAFIILNPCLTSASRMHTHLPTLYYMVSEHVHGDIVIESKNCSTRTVESSPHVHHVAKKPAERHEGCNVAKACNWYYGLGADYRCILLQPIVLVSPSP